MKFLVAVLLYILRVDFCEVLFVLFCLTQISLHHSVMKNCCNGLQTFFTKYNDGSLPADSYFQIHLSGVAVCSYCVVSIPSSSF